MTHRNAAAVIESGDPSASKDAFRRALGHFATGVTVITAEANGEKVGVTANSFNSVSLQPPLVLWSISKTSSSWPVFEAARSFNINILAADQISLSAQFAKSGTDKYRDVTWRPGQTGAPVLENVAAHFECERFAEYDGGDHWIVVGRVVQFARLDRRPLIFHQGRYGLAIDHNEASPSAADNSAFAPRVRPTFLTLFRRAFLQRSNEFRQVAQATGFTVNESRLMYHLEARPGLTSEELARVSLMELIAATDSIAALIERGWMSQGPDGVLDLTAEGLSQNDKLRQVAYAQEGAKLAQFSSAEIETALKVLATFGGTIDNIPPYQGVSLN